MALPLNAPVVGLATAPNPFSQAPAGTLATADNVRFVAPGVLAPRPGFIDTLDEFGELGAVADVVAAYNADVVVHYGSSLQVVGDSPYPGAFDAPGDARLRLVSARRDLFVNTVVGAVMLSGDADPVAAGNPPGLAFDPSSWATSSGGTWFVGSTAVAYRYTICSLDSYQRLIEGAPSGRFVVQNLLTSPAGGLVRMGTTVTVTCLERTGLQAGDVVVLTPGEADFPPGAKTVTGTPTSRKFTYTEAGAGVPSSDNQVFNITRGTTLQAQLPEGVSTANFLRFYRSDMSSSASINPSDELFLTYESGFLDSGEVSALSFSFDDVTPQSVLDVPLYCNQNTGETPGEPNYRPPVCEDMVFWANRMWFANTTNLQSLQLALIGVGAPDGVQAGDTLTIGLTTFTASAAASAPTEFTVQTDYDPSTNIRITTQNLVACVNANGFDAYYTSADNEFPGKFLVAAEDFLDTTPFTATASRPESWNPQLATAATSDNNRHPAGLWYSKLDQPESVPPFNYFLVESDSDPILRVFPLNYRLLVFKTSGIYTVTNVFPFQVTKLSEAKLVAPDSVALLNLSLYCLCDQGILRIDDSGPDSASVAIDNLVTPLLGPLRAEVAPLAFGIGVEAQRQYLLFLPAADATANSYALAYSTLSGGWTRYLFGAQGGVVTPAGTLLLAPSDNRQLLTPLLSGSDSDYHDAEFTVSVVSQSGVELLLADASAVTAGDAILDADGTPWLVLAVDGNTLTLIDEGNFNTGTTTVQPAFACNVKFNPITGGTPASLKAWRQASLLFRDNTFLSMDVAFSTEVTPGESVVELTNDAWGALPWGEFPWGNPSPQVRRVEPLPLADAQACQLSMSLQTRQANAGFTLLGVVLDAQPDANLNRG